jgi:hypothetical protein
LEPFRITGAFGTTLRVTGDFLKAGTSFLKRTIGRISEFVRDFIEVSRNFFNTKRQPKILKNH